MKKLAAQALAFQCRLQIETAQTILNNNNSSLNTIDQALHDIINATEKLKMLNNMMVNSVEEIKKNEKDS